MFLHVVGQSSCPISSLLIRPPEDLVVRCNMVYGLRLHELIREKVRVAWRNERLIAMNSHQALLLPRVVERRLVKACESYRNAEIPYLADLMRSMKMKMKMVRNARQAWKGGTEPPTFWSDVMYKHSYRLASINLRDQFRYWRKGFHRIGMYGPDQHAARYEQGV